jgi:hypothetical protein
VVKCLKLKATQHKNKRAECTQLACPLGTTFGPRLRNIVLQNANSSLQGSSLTDSSLYVNVFSYVYKVHLIRITWKIHYKQNSGYYCPRGDFRDCAEST